MSFPEFTKKYIFEPLQMTATSWSRPTDGSATELYTLHQRNGYKYKTNAGGYCYPDYPSGQLWTTSGDLAKFSLAMLKRGNLGYTTSDGADCLYTEETGTLRLLFHQKFLESFY
jgi:CubicO group peptidase (beta-lactamase class C family)